MKEYLSRKGVPFIEKNVALDRAAAQEMIRKSGQMGVPVIIIDDEVVVGFNRPALERLLAGRTAAPPSLGLKVADAASIARKRGGPASGAYVGAVTPGSAGERAGLRPGDVIIALNGRPVSNADDISRLMASFRAGQRLEIAFLRDGEPRQTSITL